MPEAPPSFILTVMSQGAGLEAAISSRRALSPTGPIRAEPHGLRRSLRRPAVSLGLCWLDLFKEEEGAGKKKREVAEDDGAEEKV